jgi:Rps23 Pro-64 3,4-dihydroxylase Tpa1-like proline 4-hydroxylase
VVRGEQWWIEDLPSPAPTTARATADLFDVRRFLHPDLEPHWPAVGEALRAGDLVHVPKALRADIADRAWAALDNAELAFGPYEGRDAQGQFHYRHHRLFDLSQEPAELRTLRLVFGSEPTRRFVEELTGDNCDDDVTVSASWFQPGEYQLPHSDNVDNRRVAFVWHLTKAWAGDFGGELHWCPTGTSVTPAFNHLSLFHTAGGNKHAVTPVAPYARGKRLCINGWWRSRAGVLENPRPPSGRLLDARLGIRALPPFPPEP